MTHIQVHETNNGDAFQVDAPVKLIKEYIRQFILKHGKDTADKIELDEREDNLYTISINNHMGIGSRVNVLFKNTAVIFHILGSNTKTNQTYVGSDFVRRLSLDSAFKAYNLLNQ